jgi:hypothetical protein
MLARENGKIMEMATKWEIRKIEHGRAMVKVGADTQKSMMYRWWRT